MARGKHAAQAARQRYEATLVVNDRLSDKLAEAKIVARTNKEMASRVPALEARIATLQEEIKSGVSKEWEREREQVLLQEWTCVGRVDDLGLADMLAAVQAVRGAGCADDGRGVRTIAQFDAGRRAATVDAAQARYEEAVSQYRARVRQAAREVEEALIALDSARGRSGDARTAAEGYRASFLATETRHRNGLASLVELEDARRNVLAAETALVQLQRELQDSWISLYRAAGGGWQPLAQTSKK